jgi:hypothetical protein
MIRVRPVSQRRDEGQSVLTACLCRQDAMRRYLGDARYRCGGRLRRSRRRARWREWRARGWLGGDRHVSVGRSRRWYRGTCCSLARGLRECLTAETTWRGKGAERKREGDASLRSECGARLKSPGGCVAYWKKTSRLKRKTQKMPIECQYQAVQSTRICRISRRWSRKRAASAAASARTPMTR